MSLFRPRAARATLVPALAATLAAGAMAAGAAAPAAAASDAGYLARPTQGAAALASLSGELPALARLNGLSTTALAGVLSEDSSAWLSPSGRLYFKEDSARKPSAPTTGRAAPFASSQTFALHSKPGSSKTLYIDFDGGTVSGTEWNRGAGAVPTTPLEGFSMDSDYGTFNAAEHELIQRTWQLVAEDYAPFDVDVTTEAPPAGAIDRDGASDTTFGTTVLVTASRAAHGARTTCEGGEGCTGIAFTDVFSEPDQHARYQPAFVFTAFNNDLHNIAESVSHEAGHNFGLLHDGKGSEDYYVGHGIWAPIMGSGDKPVIQWSNGAYTGSTEKQDDVAQIAKGAPLRADEAGSDVAGAAATIPTTGYITQRSDVDVFKLPACSGPLTLTAAAAPFAANLDIELTLLGADGATLATDNPTAARADAFNASGMGASISFAEAAGKELYARVDGVGNGNVNTGYDDYGSIGQYTLTPSCGSASGEVPGQVTGLSAVANGANGLTATWAAPASNGGSAITGYKVSLNGGAVETLPAGTTTKSFTGLTADTTYTVSVVATNAKGDGAASTATAKTGSAGTVSAPSAPSPASASFTDGTVSVSWSTPASDGGAPVTGFKVSFDGTQVASPGASARSVQLDATGVEPGTYTVSVCAVNSVGCGAPATAQVTIPETGGTLPATPVLTKASTNRRGLVTVKWAASEGATSYGVVFLKSKRGQLVATDVVDDIAGTAVKVSIYDLNRKARFVAVYAYNEAGESDLSDAVPFI